MELIGKPSINPFLFYSGKLIGYTTWVIFVLSSLNIINISMLPILPLKYVSFGTAIIGLIFTFLSIIHLCKSTKLGLPSESTVLKTYGIYIISRNPMYVGFNLFTISSVLYTQNIFILFACLYSVFIYHLIILGEEKFLENRFRSDYLNYKKRVRRYF